MDINCWSQYKPVVSLNDPGDSLNTFRERRGARQHRQQTCVELCGALMEFPGCQRAICSCPTRLMIPLLLTFESDLPASKTELWPIYILLQRHQTHHTPNTEDRGGDSNSKLMSTLTVDTCSSSSPHINHEDIDQSSLLPCNCTPCCQSFEATLLCSDQSCESSRID